MSDYNRVKNWRRRMRARLYDAFGSKCGICGYNKCMRALDFHHIDPANKTFTIGTSNIANWYKIADEARKCVMICNRCHQEVHGGITIIPDNIMRFNEDYATWPVDVIPTSPCEMCGKEKHIRLRYCSQRCCNGARSGRWNSVNLEELMKSYNYSQIGRMLGVSGNAVKKRAIKLGLVDKK